MQDLIETTIDSWESQYSTYLSQGYNLKTLNGKIYWVKK